jgi:uncharacterized cupin superfamily protein
MVQEATLEQTEAGLVPQGEGWFVVNAKEARWFEHDAFGTGTTFEGDGDAAFKDIGINIGVLAPGQPACMYHRENQQEDFLVLFGECLLIVEGEERPLKAWDFVHCPPETNHVFVGAGEGPCGILSIGHRRPREDEKLVYPVEEAARRHGAGVETETPDPRQAYAPFERPQPKAYSGQLDHAG